MPACGGHHTLSTTPGRPQREKGSSWPRRAAPGPRGASELEGAYLFDLDPGTHGSYFLRRKPVLSECWGLQCQVKCWERLGRASTEGPLPFLSSHCTFLSLLPPLQVTGRNFCRTSWTSLLPEANVHFYRDNWNQIFHFGNTFWPSKVFNCKKAKLVKETIWFP